MYDYERRDEQENLDFQTTEKIMKGIFKQYNYNCECTQCPTYSHVDATMQVSNNKREKKYTVEIKSRYTEKYTSTMPLLTEKYVYIMQSTAQGVTPLIVYLLNNDIYYIFNLETLDLNCVDIGIWTIKEKEFSTEDKFVKKTVFFIPIELASKSGKIHADN